MCSIIIEEGGYGGRRCAKPQQHPAEGSAKVTKTRARRVLRLLLGLPTFCAAWSRGAGIGGLQQGCWLLAHPNGSKSLVDLVRAQPAAGIGTSKERAKLCLSQNPRMPTLARLRHAAENPTPVRWRCGTGHSVEKLL
eukprot:2824920-Prymnesium_polylepis.3